MLRSIQGSQTADRDGRSHVTASVTAHTVGDQQKVRAHIAGVLIVLTHQTDIGADGGVEHDFGKFVRHACSSIVVLPIRTGVKAGRGTAP